MIKIAGRIELWRGVREVPYKALHVIRHDEILFDGLVAVTFLKHHILVRMVDLNLRCHGQRGAIGIGVFRRRKQGVSVGSAASDRGGRSCEGT